MTWPRFLGIHHARRTPRSNALFAVAFLLCGPDALGGTAEGLMGGRFLRAFFFSVETFATVGYGNVYPIGTAANLHRRRGVARGAAVRRAAHGARLRPLRPAHRRPAVQRGRRRRAVPGGHRADVPRRQCAQQPAHGARGEGAVQPAGRGRAALRPAEAGAHQGRVLPAELDGGASDRRRQPAVRARPRRPRGERRRAGHPDERDRRVVRADRARAHQLQARGDRVRCALREHLQSRRGGRRDQHRRVAPERHRARAARRPRDHRNTQTFRHTGHFTGLVAPPRRRDLES